LSYGDNLHYEKFADGSVKCIEDEIPFELPDGWAWSKVGPLCEYITSGSRGWAQYYSDTGSLFLRMGNLSRDSFELRMDNLQRVDLPDNAEGVRTRVTENDLLFSITAEIGMLGLIPADFEEAYINQHVGLIRFLKEAQAKYFPYILMSDFCRNQYYTTQSGMKNSFRLDNIQNILTPVPPLAEQIRIAEKLSCIWAQIQQIDSESATARDIIILAKAKILDLAIRGQLVPQDPSDEPASVLLEHIRAEKEELIRQGKIKRDKKESVIFRGEDNSYYVCQDTHTESINEQFIFELPGNWEWCSLLNIAKIELGKTLDSAKNIGTNYPYLRSMNVRWNEVDLSDLKEMRFEPEELDRYTVRRNDLLICEGGDVGRSCVWTDEKEILYQNALHRVRFYGGCNPFYFMYYMMYYESRGIIKTLCKGVTIKHLTGNVLSLIPFALPPIEEQGRIVERLNRIFVLLDSIICD
jgi:type I restriction enzyme S subunit